MDAQPTELPRSRDAIVALILGIVSVLASGPLLGIAYALHSVFLINHSRRAEAGAFAVASVLVAAIPFSAWAYFRDQRAERDGRARASSLALIGLVLTVAGCLGPFVGILMIAGFGIVAVVFLWLTSLL